MVTRFSSDLGTLALDASTSCLSTSNHY